MDGRVAACGLEGGVEGAGRTRDVGARVVMVGDLREEDEGGEEEEEETETREFEHAGWLCCVTCMVPFGRYFGTGTNRVGMRVCVGCEMPDWV